MSRKPERDVALDLLKGALVVGMVIYHTMNIFTTATAEAFGYVRFVSGSFIIVAGYVAASFYEARFVSAPWETSKRMIIRGLKLFAIFVGLNSLILFSGFGNPVKSGLDPADWQGRLIDVLVLGEPGKASFQILLAIAYFLMLAPLILAFRRKARWILAFALAAACVLSIVGGESVNLEFVLLGIVGACSGVMFRLRPTDVQDHSVWLSIVGVAVCIAAMPWLDMNLMAYALGVLVLLKCLYDLLRRAPRENWMTRSLDLLGQYSLVSYIGQILVLQILFRLAGAQKIPLGLEAGVVAAFTTLVLIVGCNALARLRLRFVTVERSYRLIFS